MDCCEEDVIVVCELYLLSDGEMQKNRKYWIPNMFRAREETGEFQTLFGHLKADRQIIFKYFRMSFSKFENLKQLLHTDIGKKNTKWRRHMRTEERLALTSSKCIIPNNLSTGSSKQIKTPQKSEFLLKMWRL
jgi:hypothetical protein